MYNFLVAMTIAKLLPRMCTYTLLKLLCYVNRKFVKLGRQFSIFLHVIVPNLTSFMCIACFYCRNT